MSTADKAGEIMSLDWNTDQLEQLLRSSPDPGHARALLSVVLAARRPLTVSEFKVVFALTEELDDGRGRQTAYEDLKMIEVDHYFQAVADAICCPILVFAKGTVRLLDDSVREYLMKPNVEKGGTPEELSFPSLAASHELLAAQGLWKHSFTVREANVVMARVCLEILNLDASEEWVNKV